MVPHPGWAAKGIQLMAIEKSKLKSYQSGTDNND